MQRKTWTFGYSALVLTDAAKSKVAHHKEREKFWRAEYDKAEKILREEGMTFREQAVSGGTRMDAVLDPKLAWRVEECRAKIAGHESKREEYEAYANALSKARPETVFELGVDDVVWFGL